MGLCDVIHRVLLSLVLHSNDNAVDYRSETRDASRQALAKTLDIFSVTNTTTDPNVDKVREPLKLVGAFAKETFKINF